MDITSHRLGFIIANVSQFMETFDPRATKEKTQQDGLKEYLRHRELPKHISRRIRRYGVPRLHSFMCRVPT